VDAKVAALPGRIVVLDDDRRVILEDDGESSRRARQDRQRG
jgi:hypothetical protein